MKKEKKEVKKKSKSMADNLVFLKLTTVVFVIISAGLISASINDLFKAIENYNSMFIFLGIVCGFIALLSGIKDVLIYVKTKSE